ncbi:MAG: hypothetical protein Q9227_000481 [Pyrenula ochraceoflavens]
MAMLKRMAASFEKLKDEVRLNAATSFDAVAQALPGNPSDAQSLQPVDLDSSISFELIRYQAIRTLSTNTGGKGDPIEGLLYVPDLFPMSSCINITQPLVPRNVTRRKDLPPLDYPLLALAPWVSINCTNAYLSAASFDDVRGFIFYKPDNGTTEPPPVSDPQWTLQDGGRWKSNYDFPVYAIPGMIGNTLMQQLAKYSGNITSVPYGQTIQSGHPGYDFVRLSGQIHENSGPQLPSLWVFLIIVLACLIGIVGFTSCVMHLVQRRRRVLLRRRVMAGEVNLEAIGVKRINVPKDHLDKLPLVMYKTSSAIKDADKSQSPGHPSETAHGNVAGVPGSPSTVEAPSSENQSNLMYSQLTCPICLDEFVDNRTTVRELPCRHIFHPECIDGFLQKTSSLCPMCKKSVLPKGYVPPVITNAMVRRERMTRAIAERDGQTNTTLDSPIHQINATDTRNRTRRRTYRAPTHTALRDRSTSFGPLVSVPRRVSQAVVGGRRISSAPSPTTEMQSLQGRSAEESVTAQQPHTPFEPELRPEEISRRRASAANRLINLVSERRTLEEEEMERQRRLPNCECPTLNYLVFLADLLTFCRAESRWKGIS